MHDHPNFNHSETIFAPCNRNNVLSWNHFAYSHSHVYHHITLVTHKSKPIFLYQPFLPINITQDNAARISVRNLQKLLYKILIGINLPRHAIKRSVAQNNRDTLQRFFGHTVSNTKGKLTNSEFITLITGKLLLQLKSDQVANF